LNYSIGKSNFQLEQNENYSALNKNLVGKIKLLHKSPYGRCGKPNFLKPVST